MSAADDAVGAKVGEDVRKALTRADREEAKVLFGLGFTGIFVLGGFELLLDGLKVVGGLGLAAGGELLGLWQRFREKIEDPLERTLLCNAGILRDSCYCQGEAIYGDELEVLRDLTPGEMEDLLLRLAEGEALPDERGGTFDLQRFADMKGE